MRSFTCTGTLGTLTWEEGVGFSGDDRAVMAARLVVGDGDSVPMTAEGPWVFPREDNLKGAYAAALGAFKDGLVSTEGEVPQYEGGVST